jgi:hypothetical protein
MILIFSINSDTSTSDVIDWLLSMEAEVYRINNIFDFQPLLKKMEEIDFDCNSIVHNFNNIHSIWYRKNPQI